MLYRIVIGITNTSVNCLSLALFRTLEVNGHNIRELEFIHCSIQSCQLLEMPTVLGRLAMLKISNQDNGPDVMQTLGNLCSNIRHLNLSRFGKTSVTGNYGVYKDDIEVLLCGLKDSLISLALDEFNDERRDKLQIRHSPFIHCTKLQKLDLNGGGINAEDIMAIGRLGSLTELIIHHKKNIMDEDFKEAFEQQQMIGLQHCNMWGNGNFRKKATMALLKYCPNLISLDGQFEGFEEAVADCGPRNLKLQKLEIGALNRNVIMAVASLCNLQELHITFAKNLKRQDFRDAFHQGNLVNLEVIKLGLCPNLDSEGFTALLKNSSKLKHVKLFRLPGVTGYSDIFADCNLDNLTTFNARNCPGLYGRDVDFLKQSCPQIKEPQISRCGYFDKIDKLQELGLN
jgi:hypothetical protein